MRRNKMKIAVLFGGRSAEREVSIDSARSVINALDKKKYQIIPVFISKSGRWFDYENSLMILQGRKSSLHKISASSCLILKKADVVFPVLHGPYGEDGRVQGMLDILDKPYIGTGVLASALGMHKVLQRYVFAAARLPLVKWFSFRQDEWRKQQGLLLKKIALDFCWPVFVKPVDLGSSIGIQRITAQTQLEPAIQEALLYSNEVIIEQGLDAREIECAVLGNNNPQASIPGEIISSGEFYDYKAKYIDNKSKLLIPAPLSDSLRQKIQRFSLRAFQAIRAKGMARVDFLLERQTNKLYLNEINTIPGFTQISMYPKLWEVSGIKYSKLMDILISLAIERHKKERRREVGKT